MRLKFHAKSVATIMERLCKLEYHYINIVISINVNDKRHPKETYFLHLQFSATTFTKKNITKLSESEKMENMSHFVYNERYFLHFILSFSKTIYTSKAII